MFGLCLPKGTIYIDEMIRTKSIMSIDLDNYDDFLRECEWIFNIYDCNKIIYNDEFWQVEITREEYLKLRG